MNSARPTLAVPALLAVALASLTGCYTVEANLPGTLRNDVKPEHVEPVGRLQVEKTNWFFLLALVGDPPKDFFAAEIKKQVQAKGADGVANLTYESEFGCVDLLITGVTFGCVSPRTYKLSGDIVRIKAARVPGKPAKTVEHRAGEAPEGEARIAQSY
jgi:hypothetical protein